VSVSEEQRQALSALRAIVSDATYLAGGIAVALHLHHRASRDLDLFVPGTDPSVWAQRLSPGSARVLTRTEGTLYVEIATIPASILRYDYPLLNEAEVIEGIAVPVASMDDLECMKLSAIASRGARRDFWDLHAMLIARGRSLQEALQNYPRKFAIEDIGHVVKALTYFEDAEAEPMPMGMTPEHWEVITSDLRNWVRALAGTT
jgi:hypothetical protein